MFSPINSGVGARTRGGFVFVYPRPILFTVTDAIEPLVIVAVAVA